MYYVFIVYYHYDVALSMTKILNNYYYKIDVQNTQNELFWNFSSKIHSNPWCCTIIIINRTIKQHFINAYVIHAASCLPNLILFAYYEQWASKPQDTRPPNEIITVFLQTTATLGPFLIRSDKSRFFRVNLFLKLF